MRGLLAISVLLILVACDTRAEQGRTDLKPNDRLLAAESDDTRLQLIQKQFRGLDQPMWEVGERYGGLHDALLRQNPELAAYHWEKIMNNQAVFDLKSPGDAGQ